MKGKRVYIDYLEDILDAVEKAQRFVAVRKILTMERK